MNSRKDEKRWGGFSAPRAEGGAGTSRAGPVGGERLWERGQGRDCETEQTFRWCAFFCVGGTAREVPAPPSARGAVGRLGRGQFNYRFGLVSAPFCGILRAKETITR